MDGPICVAGFLVVVDVAGARHAVRLGSISALRDADEDRTEALIILQGGRDAILVRHAFDEVLSQIIGR
jgi:hypothetical protein